MAKWQRVRFFTDSEDYRPVTFPPPGPFWCSGYDSGGSAIMIAWFQKRGDLKKFWPEAKVDEWYEPTTEIEFTGRFPKPNWWRGPRTPIRSASK